MADEIDFDREEIKALMEEATLSMTGHPVKIYLRVPKQEGGRGQAYKETDGFAIDLMPTLEPIVFYETWLHEVGHIYLGHCDELEPVDYSDLAPELIAVLEKGYFIPAMTEDEFEAYKNLLEEKSADGFASQMHHIARNMAFDEFFTFNVPIETLIGNLKRINLKPYDRLAKGE